MNTVLAPEAISRIQTIKKDLLKKSGEIDAALSHIDQILGNGDTASSTSNKPVQHRRPKRQTKKAAVPREKRSGIMQATVELLAKGPLSTPDILKQLTESGHVVNGKRAIQTITGILHKDAKNAAPRVVRKDKLWHLVQTQN